MAGGMDLEELKAKLQSECSRSDIFERKNAELEGINDKLRTENDGLLLEVRELKERLSFLSQVGDPSDSSEDEQDYESFVRGNQVATAKGRSETTPPPSSEANLTVNHNHCNANGTSGHSNHNVAGNHSVAGNHDTDSSFKIQTLKRKQKALKAELEQSMYKTISFKEAFQKEMDLRSKLDDKFDNLRVRYERMVMENDDLRTVLVNHCINVPPHQPITGKRQAQKSRVPFLQHPPPFVPPGRPKSRLSSGSGQTPSSPNLSISSNKSSDNAPPTVRVTNSQERSSDELSSSKSPEATSVSDIQKKVDGNSRSPREDTPSSLGDVAELSGSDMSDFENEVVEEEDGNVEHIVFEDSIETPTTGTPIITQDMDDLLVATSDQIENARIFYDLVRERLRLEEEESD